jgi:hypothetical protein
MLCHDDSSSAYRGWNGRYIAFDHEAAAIIYPGASCGATEGNEVVHGGVVLLYRTHLDLETQHVVSVQESRYHGMGEQVYCSSHGVRWLDRYSHLDLARERVPAIP